MIVAFIPNEKLSEPIKMTIICGCIGIPIIILQISLTVGQNQIDDKINNTNITCSSIKENIGGMNISIKKDLDNIFRETKQFISLHQIYSSKNERVKRFADRRIAEMINTLTTANQIGNSGFLEVREYYAELDFLADKLEKDNGGNSSIWAMTGFAPDEWSAAGGYEKAWTERLKKLSQMNIKTNRLCLLNNEIIQKIKDENFKAPKRKNRGTALEGFISLLKDYYQDDQSNCKHYILLNNEFSDLEKTKGFFGIVLSNNEKHIIEGEAVNLDNGLTGKVLFKNEDIEKLFTDFMHACQPNREIINFINENASKAFKDYLISSNIKL